MFWIVYRFFISLLELAIRIVGVWHNSTKIFLRGRRDQETTLKPWIDLNDDSIIQIHAASLGEFELSLPLYEELKRNYPSHKFLFTFFSPSGYQHAKIPSGAAKAYLPIDRKNKVNNFLKTINPSLVIFIKYEFWFEYLNQLKNKNIPYGFVNVNQQQYPFNLKFTTAKKLVNNATFIYSSNDKTTNDLKTNGIRVDETYLDLRYTKSRQLLNENYKLNPAIENHLKNNRTIICGSVWKEDLQVLIPIIKKHRDIAWVIAPHKVDSSNINYVKGLLPNVVLFSENKAIDQSNTLLIDTIGDLKYLYRYGQLNYIGGGFNTGLHNVLEPIAVGVPVVFGPEYHSYPEAMQLIEKEIGHSIKNAEEFDQIIKSLKDGSLHLTSNNWITNQETGLSEMAVKIGKQL